MDCKDIEELLYDFVTGRLGREEAQRVEAHLTGCKSCQADLVDLRKALSLLDEWKPPELSPDFKNQVMRRIEEQFPEQRVSMLQKIVETLFRPLPLGGLAVAIIALFTFTFYFKGLGPEGEKPEVATRGFEMPPKVAEAKRPIVVEIKDIDAAFTQLSKIIQSHSGKLIRKRSVESGMEATFKLDESREDSLFNELHKLGKVSMPKEGHKDGEGNIVLVLKKGT